MGIVRTLETRRVRSYPQYSLKSKGQMILAAEKTALVSQPSVYAGNFANYLQLSLYFVANKSFRPEERNNPNTSIGPMRY